MATIAQQIAGQIVGIATKHMPDYSFAALVHRDEDVALYLFKGRVLERRTALAPGSATLGLFKDMRAETTVKTGFFKRQSYLTARVCVRARGRKLSMQCDFEDANAYTPTTDDKRAAYTTVMRDDIPDPAKSMFADALQNGLSPSDIARHFMADYDAWNTYALAESAFDDSEARWNQQQSYDTLIVRYCGPDKTYQGLSFGTSSRHAPPDERVVAEDIGGDRAWVTTHYQDPEHAFITHDYKYEFHRTGPNGPWQLTELWYLDDSGDELPLL